MGVIQIRARSERLGNLGSVTPPTLETGEAGYWDAVGRSAQALGRAGMEVAGFLARQKKESDERAVNDAVAEYQSRMADYNAAKDAEAVDGAATDAWVDGNVTWRDDLKEHIRSGRGLSDGQFREFNKRVVGYDISTQNRWQTRATATRNDYDVARTGESLKLAIDNAVTDGASPTAWLDVDGALAANVAALERKQGRTFSPEERVGMTKGVLVAAQTRRYDLLAASTAESDDPETVQKDWDKRRADLDEKGWAAESDAILAKIGGKLSEADTAAVKDHFEACAEKAVAAAHRRQGEAWRKARERATERENAILSRPLPETEEARLNADAETARLYQTLAKDETLSATDRNHYAGLARSWQKLIESGTAERKAREARLADAADKAAGKARRTAEEETGYLLTLEGEKGQEKRVWISPTGWGKTGASGEELISPTACAEDPQKALVSAETLRATGNISKEDYRNTITQCYYLQRPRIAEAVNKALGGNFLKVLDTDRPGEAFKSLGYDDPLAGLAPGEDYAPYDPEKEFDPDSKADTTFSYTFRDIRKGKTERKLFTTEERKNLFRKIGWMAARGYTDEQIDTAVKAVMQPKIELYHDLLMERRMADPSFVELYKTIGPYDERVNAEVGRLKKTTVEKVK